MYVIIDFKVEIGGDVVAEVVSTRQYCPLAHFFNVHTEVIFNDSGSFSVACISLTHWIIVILVCLFSSNFIRGFCMQDCHSSNPNSRLSGSGHAHIRSIGCVGYMSSWTALWSNNRR